jgi:hypothetical protein
MAPNGRCGTDSGEKAPFLTPGVKKVRKWGFRWEAEQAATRGSSSTNHQSNHIKKTKLIISSTYPQKV